MNFCLFAQGISIKPLHTRKKNHIFVVCLYFSKLSFSRNYFRNIKRVTNSVDPDQARHFVGPDLDPNCLYRLSAEGICGLRVKAATELFIQNDHPSVFYS